LRAFQIFDPTVPPVAHACVPIIDVGRREFLELADQQVIIINDLDGHDPVLPLAVFEPCGLV